MLAHVLYLRCNSQVRVRFSVRRHAFKGTLINARHEFLMFLSSFLHSREMDVAARRLHQLSQVQRGRNTDPAQLEAVLDDANA
jgi:hypothetical protein